MKDIKFKTLQPFVLNTARLGNIVQTEMLCITTSTLYRSTPQFFGVIIYRNEQHNGKCSINYLPLINFEPSNMYTTLKYILKITKAYIFPVVAFDQPLWLIAMEIISTETADEALKTLIVLLGNFHTQMSFLGTMGHIMENRRLSEIFETTYARNSVQHILCGKAHERAVHAHNLLSTVLQRKICKMAQIDADLMKKASNGSVWFKNRLFLFYLTFNKNYIGIQQLFTEFKNLDFKPRY